MEMAANRPREEARRANAKAAPIRGAIAEIEETAEVAGAAIAAIDSAEGGTAGDTDGTEAEGDAAVLQPARSVVPTAAVAGGGTSRLPRPRRLS